MTSYEQERRTDPVEPGAVSVGDLVLVESSYDGVPESHPARVVEIDGAGTIFVDVIYDEGRVVQRRMRI